MMMSEILGSYIKEHAPKRMGMDGECEVSTAAWSPRVRLCRAEVLQPPARRGDVSPGPRVHVKEEQEEVWIGHGGADDVPRAPSAAGVPVKREEEEEEDLEEEPGARASEPNIKPEPQSPPCTAGDSKTGIKKFIERRVHCPVCELECVSRAHLRTHARVHTGERPFACADCGKAYTTTGCLNRHRQSVHRGDRPFRCHHCTFRTAAKSGLSRHLRVHTGERPFACSFCGLRFSQSGNLMKHIDLLHRITSLKYKVKA